MLRLLLCHLIGDFCPGQDIISEGVGHVKTFSYDSSTNFSGRPPILCMERLPPARRGLSEMMAIILLVLM